MVEAAAEAKAEAKVEAKAAASPHKAMTHEDFARHFVKVGLYSTIYGAFVSEIDRGAHRGGERGRGRRGVAHRGGDVG